jgi:hypothetical protein
MHVWDIARTVAWVFIVAGLASALWGAMSRRYAKVGAFMAVTFLVGTAAVLVLGRVAS